MHTLPTDFDFSLLTGLTVEMICFAGFSTYVDLENGAVITIEGTYALSDENNVHIESNSEFPRMQSVMIRLLNQKVTKVDIIGKDILLFTFSNNYSLKLSGDYGYESYHIKLGTREIHI